MDMGLSDTDQVQCVGTIGYFRAVQTQTPTEFWINNATPEQVELAISWGAVGATTNPTYPPKLLGEVMELESVLDDLIAASNDDDEVADQFYMITVKNLSEKLVALYRSSGGKHGYTAIQGNPFQNTDPGAIIAAAQKYRELDENIIVKVPATPAGAIAMTDLTSLGFPTIATLSFSVDQTVFMAEAYYHGLKRWDGPPPTCYITFIAGLLDEHLINVCKELGEPIPLNLVRKAGCESTREAYRIFKERGYQPKLMGGAVRGPHHFTELLGGDLAVTMGSDIAQTLIDSNPPLCNKIDSRLSQEEIRLLEKYLSDFTKAFHLGSLKPEEFADYPPVRSFQNTFLNAYTRLLEIIRSRRRLQTCL